MKLRSILMLLLLPALVACGKEHNNQTELPDEIGQEGADRELITPEVQAIGEEVRSRGWKEPQYTPKEEAAILDSYKQMDPDHEIPTNLLKKALLYFHRNQELIP